MSERSTYEGDLFRRYEARIVALEVEQEALRDFARTYKPLVDKLETDRAITEAVAKRIVEGHRYTLSRVQVLIAIIAVIVPPMLTALLVHLWATN